MKLTLAQMEAFLWTARLGSAMAAATRLGLTQPSVTLRLQEFRRTTGVDAFRRTPQGLRLTTEGDRLLERVVAVLDLTEAIKGQHDGAPAGPFRLGLAEAFAVTCLPRLLPQLTAELPALKPEITVAASWELETPLLQARLDLAVLADPLGTGLRTVPLGIHDIHWVAGLKAGLREPITPERMRTVPIIVNPPGSAMHRRMTNWFGVGGVQPDNVGFCSSGAVILHMVAAGVAVSLAPESMVRCYASSGDIRILASEPALAPGHLYLCERAGSSSEAARRVSGIIRKLVSETGHIRSAPRHSI